MDISGNSSPDKNKNKRITDSDKESGKKKSDEIPNLLEEEENNEKNLNIIQKAKNQLNDIDLLDQESSDSRYNNTEKRINLIFDYKGEKTIVFLGESSSIKDGLNGFIQKRGISVDEPNHSLDILMTKTPEALEYFRRYAKFYLKGIGEGDPNTCWRVEAVDGISMEGVLQINAVEYYANETEDDMENGLVNGLVVLDSLFSYFQ